MQKIAGKIIVIGLAVILLSGCNTFDRLSRVGEAPEFTQIDIPETKPGHKPISVPMPAKNIELRQANSLWSGNRKSFFKDQRASQIGDILTVVIEIDDEATLTNESTRSRSSAEDAQIPSMLGLETYLNQQLPDVVDPTNLADVSSSSSTAGEGEITREEEIELRIAAMITEVLPNGNMIVRGRQEVRVNTEVRDLYLSGIIRPEDISSDNSITYDKIAEARIAYGGRGMISDVQGPRYGQEIYDILFPF